MLAALIQRHNKKIFWIQFKNERLTEILQAVIRHVNDRINTTYNLTKPFLDNKMSIFEEYGAFKQSMVINIGPINNLS